MMTILKLLFRGIFSLLLIGALLVYGMVSTESGLHWTFSLAEAVLPGKLTVVEIKGNLQHMSLAGLSYQDDAMKLQIANLQLDWSLIQLFDSTLMIKYLSADHVQIHLLTQAETKEQKTQGWIKYLFITEANIIDVKLFRDKKLMTSISSLTTITNSAGQNDFNIMVGEHKISGSYLYHDLTKANWEFSVSGNNINTNYLYPETDGVITFSLNAKSSETSQGKRMALSLTKLSGTVHGYQATGQADIALNNDSLYVQKLGLQVGNATLKAQGDIGDKWNITWSLNIPDLAMLVPSLSGSYTSHGRVVRENNRPVLSATVNLKGAKLARLGKTDISAEVIYTPENSSEIFPGSVNVRNGVIKIPLAGVNPSAINFNILLAKNGLVTVNGSFMMGGGQAKISGNINVTDDSHPVNLTIQGNNLQTVNNDEYNITSSPDLKLSMRGEDANLTGSILFPILKISLKKFDQIVELPPEVVFAGDERKTEYFKKLNMNLTVRLGSDAHLDYNNISADLAGQITVYQIPGGLPYGKGVITITHGIYDIYNKKFSIKNGRLIYVGNLLSDPGINIRAMLLSSSPQFNFLGYQIDAPTDNSKIEVVVTGTLNKTNISLVSNPPMSQDDILSTLLFGRARSDVSGVDALGLLGNLGSSMNLDGAGASDDDSESAGLLSFNPMQALNLSIPISKHIRIQTETSFNEVGVDVMYQYDVEK